MVVVRIEKIIWSDYTKEHIKKHSVTIEEAETVIKSDSIILTGHSGKKILVNRVKNRIIAVICKMDGNKLFIATARDADKFERSEFYEFEKIKTNTKI